MRENETLKRQHQSKQNRNRKREQMHEYTEKHVTHTHTDTDTAHMVNNVHSRKRELSEGQTHCAHIWATHTDESRTQATKTDG